MNELAQALIAESYAAPPSHILEGLTDNLAHRELPNVPHTIYAELWHLAFWQKITLDWIAGIETPYPNQPSDGFPQKSHTEPWEQLRQRFLHGADKPRPPHRTPTASTIPSAAHPAPAHPPASCPCATSSSRSPPTTPTTSAASSFSASSSRPGLQPPAASPGSPHFESSQARRLSDGQRVQSRNSRTRGWAFMIRRCDPRDFESIWAIINDGAQAYKGIIPADRWTDPTCPAKKLQHEIDDGVIFWGYEDAGTLVAVMGIQQVQDVTLIRHAYVRTTSQKQGIGALLLSHLREHGQQSRLDRHLGRCSLGDPFLRTIRLSNRSSRRKTPAAQKVLDRTRPPDRNLRSPRRSRSGRRCSDQAQHSLDSTYRDDTPSPAPRRKPRNSSPHTN